MGRPTTSGPRNEAKGIRVIAPQEPFYTRERADQLSDARDMLNLHRERCASSEELTAMLRRTDEHSVQAILEALTDEEGEVLA